MSATSPLPITSLLVANRGEIARRVFRTARSMGMTCVAVYVDADADAPHVREADEAVRLSSGYLDADAIIEAATATGAEAVHPGYGFLSENASFARAVIDAGLGWVGPSPEAIETMGDKLAAKRLAEEVGVPTLPSSDDVSDTSSVGFPLLVKAAAGGGGKGMRVVEDPAQLDEAVAAARREAASGFGDDRVFLERYVARARHVEIQVLGDSHGALVHLGERECSIQRRHQKIIEESPSPIVDHGLRAAMGDAALAIAGALGYQSAGTVELLVDDATRDFYFLEVNTRLQVEHPVTEEVTGIDLVREQLRIAAGEPLGFDQDDVARGGHAIEARLYAEDVAAGFLPATGTLAAFAPAPEPAVRWDAGVEQGSVVGLEFDPMLAKVIAHAPTRSEAAGRLALALERLHLGGVTTNRDLLVATLRHPRFLGGDTTTDFLERCSLTSQERRAEEPNRDDPELRRALVAAALWLQGESRAASPVLRSVPTGWRNARLPAQRVELAVGDRTHELSYERRRDGSFQIGDESQARVHGWAPGSIDVEIDGRRSSHRVTRAGDRLHLQTVRGTLDIDVMPRFPLPGTAATAGGLHAPMPGVARDVRVSQGDSVTAGQVLVVLEAMKMEHHITAPIDGMISEVRVSEGAQVGNGDMLLVIEEHGASQGDEA